MPWTCTCDVSLDDDIRSCPDCGMTKEAWTLHVDQTRALRISGARKTLECRRGTFEGTLPVGDSGNSEFETVKTTVAPVLAKAMLRAIVDRGEEPAPAHRLIVRVRPRGDDREVILSVELDGEEPLDVELSGDGLPLSSGAFDLQCLCVFGAEDVSDISLAGVHLIDVTQAEEPGYAPTLEAAAVKQVVELETELVEDSVPAVELLEVEDICFATGREILLPGGWSRSDELTGLTVVAAALAHARHHPERRLLVAGHADQVGSVADNMVLSEDRATNVHLYLTGQKDAWAEHCLKHQEVKDIQSVLKWIWWQHEWECDPGPIDGDWGSGSKKARDAFRDRYNADFNGSLGSGKQSAADWAAFFDLYEVELAAKLKTEPQKLSGLRGQVKLCDPPTLGCSEHWPTERPDAPDSDAADRRVDVLYFAEANLPALPGATPGEAIYGEGTYTRDYMTVDEAFAEPEPPYGDAPFSEECEIKKVCDKKTKTEDDANRGGGGDGGGGSGDTDEQAPSYLDKSVSYSVELVPQTSTMSCWAASCAMIVAWRDQVSIDDKAIVDRLGYWEQYRDGLNPENTVALHTFGLHQEPLQTYTAQGLADLLEAHGPLWVAANVNGLPHVRVLHGITGDGTSGGTTVFFNDPGPVGVGSRYSRSLAFFSEEYGGLAEEELARFQSPIYVAHA